MASDTHDQIMKALEQVEDPELHRDLVSLGMVGGVEIVDSVARIKILLTIPGCPLKAEITNRVNDAVSVIDGIDRAEIEFGVMSDEQRSKIRGDMRGGREVGEAFDLLPADCRVIAVASGKGGVGKSTVAANLALALAAGGDKVGLIDADIYGYSIPQIMGVKQKPVNLDGMMMPVLSHGVQVMSIGYFTEDDGPITWRGPMLHRAMQQFLVDVHWGEIKWLVIDMPPGTGDVAISLSNLIPHAELVIVTTPQKAAQQVATRAALAAHGMNQSVIGVIENMSGEGTDAIFGSGGGLLLSEQIGVPLFGQVSLRADIRESGDNGTPAVLSSEVAKAEFDAIAQAIRSAGMGAQAPAEPSAAKRIKKPLAMV